MKVFTQPKLFDEGHFMAGDEGVSLRVVAPSGALTREKLNVEDGKRFSAPLQVGTNRRLYFTPTVCPSSFCRLRGLCFVMMPLVACNLWLLAGARGGKA